MNITDPTRDVIGCTRLSSEGQTLGYGQGAQVNDLQTYARTHALNLAGFVHEVQSGADAIADRNVVQDYYRLARKHPGLGFLFPRVDRLGRLAELIIGIARDLIRLNARVYVVGYDKPLNPDDPHWLMFQFNALMAEQNYVGLIKTMRKGSMEKAARGLWPHGKPPWAYRMTRDDRGRSLTPEPIPERAVIIQRIYDLAERHGQIATAQMMRDEGHEAPTVSGWTVGGIGRVLNNPRYQGFAQFGPHLITYPAIIQPEQWLRVQTLIRQRVNQRVNTYHTARTLIGIARCPECGGAMAWVGVKTYRARKAGTDEHYGYYRCWRTAYGTAKGAAGCTNRDYFPEVATDDAVWALFTETITTPDLLGAFLKPPTPEAADHTARIEQLKGQMSSAFSRAIIAGLPDDVLERTLAPMRSELARLEAMQGTTPTPQAIDYTAIAEDWRTILTAAAPTERRELMTLCHFRVALKKTGHTVLHINPPTP